jgi:hypothetical protein
MKLKSVVSKFLTNKWVLNIVSFIALLNVIGYMVMGNFNNVIFFIVLAVLVRYFSKNMIIVLGIPLIIVNLFMRDSSSKIEGMETNNTNSKIVEKAVNEKKLSEQVSLPGTLDDGVVSSNVKTDEQFEVGRPKNKGSQIDYASTIENAYDDLNKILGSDGIKNLTTDTQNLMKQQMELAKSMEAMTPLIQGIMPMAEKAQEMMKSMETNGGGLGSVMDLAKKISGGNLSNNAAPVTKTN